MKRVRGVRRIIRVMNVGAVVLLSGLHGCLAFNPPQQQQSRSLQQLHHGLGCCPKQPRHIRSHTTHLLLSKESPLNGDDHHQHHHRSNRVSSLLSRIRSIRRTSDSTSAGGTGVYGAEEQFHHHSDADPSSQHVVPSTNSPVVMVSSTTTDNDEVSLDKLQKENEKLRKRLNNLEEENEMLHYELSSRVVLETFEGEGKLRKLAELKKFRDDLDNEEDEEEDDVYKNDDPTLTWMGEEIMLEASDALWCDELDEDDSCPVEPMVSFGEALRDRAYWLVGLLILQSCSGIILARNEALLANHPVIVYFLTMLVGAGGNAGNQASVRVIRGLALGTLNEQTQGQFLTRELKMAMALSLILSFAGFIRAAVFRTPLPETIAVTSALLMIVFSSVCLGAILPLILKKLRVDPAHSSTTIQVVMDILGVVLAVLVSSLLLDSPIGTMLVSKLGG